MKIAIVSDTQGNAPAFKAVLKHIEDQKVDYKVHLGNIVGGCPYPNECIDLTIRLFNFIFRGRNDIAAIDKDGAMGFNNLEKDASLWTYDNTSKMNKEVILRLKGLQVWDSLLFTNSSPAHDRLGIRNEQEASNNFTNPILPFENAFIGGTGVPSIWIEGKNGIKYLKPRFTDGQIGESSYDLKVGDKHIINVGSVGMPKDNDSRATYAIYNAETRKVTIYRIPYSIDITVGKMQQKNFSTNACSRLLYGN